MSLKTSKSGFTIVELLIVIVIIAILAAITIVAYNGIQQRALESAISSDLNSAGQKFELLRVTTETYPAQTDIGLEAADVTISKGLYTTSSNNLLYCGSTTTTNYALVAISKSGKMYAYGNNRLFGEYTTYPISSYAAICTDLVGTAAARYGYVGGWRAWTGP